MKTETFITIIRWSLIISICIAILTGVFFVLFDHFKSTASPSSIKEYYNACEDEECQATVDNEDFARQFITEYLDAIKNQNFDLLSSEFWEEDVVNEIKSTCSSPFDVQVTENVSQLWKSCARLQDIKYKVIEITSNSQGYVAVIQFYDEDGNITGVELHPDWVQGHRLNITKTDQGFKTKDWNFLR